MFVQLRDKFALSTDTLNPFQGQMIRRLARHRPTLYLAAMLAAASLGYLFLLSFPALVLTMPSAISDSLSAATSVEDWAGIALRVSLLLSAGWMCHAIYRTGFRPPSGVELDEESFPRLFELIRELQAEYGDPRIDRVVVRDRFDIRIVKTPCNGFPYRTRRTLVIGLPVLLAVSAADFKVLLARRVGQLAGRYTRLNSWLFGLRDMWVQYLAECGAPRSGPQRVICAFFAYYARLYREISAPLARESELEADRYALQAADDTDTARAITAQVLAESFLTHTFWPALARTAAGQAQRTPSAHGRLAKLFHAGLSPEQIQSALQHSEKELASGYAPSLAERLDIIGHTSPLLPPPVTNSAAVHYLGGACKQCVAVMDHRLQEKLRRAAAK